MPGKKFITVLLLFTSLSLLAHEFYISIFEIQLKAERIELRCKVFNDDLHKALLSFHAETNQNLEANVMDKIQLQNLLNQRAIIYQNKQRSNWRVFRAEDKEDAIWISAVCTRQDDLNQVDLEVDLLIDIYDEQTNLIKLNDKGSRRIKNLNKRVRKASFSINP